jgi:endonuclease YncB( thermonuclease family)
MAIVFAVLTALAAVLTWWNEKRVEGMGKAIDGDSILLAGEELRLKGIDAPEFDQICDKDGKAWRCGETSKIVMARELARGPLLCRSSERDKYGRRLATCTVAGMDLNGFMVRSGAAISFGGYEREEAEARDAKRGVWSSRFDPPQEWRRAHPHGPRQIPIAPGAAPPQPSPSPRPAP